MEHRHHSVNSIRHSKNRRQQHHHKRDLIPPPAAILRVSHLTHNDFGRQNTAATFSGTAATSIKSAFDRDMGGMDGGTMTSDPNENGGLYLELVRAMSNLTKYTGDNAKFKCDAVGRPVPTFKWYKNEAPMLSNTEDMNGPQSSTTEEEDMDLYDNKYSIKNSETNSVLRLRNLEVHDRGFYRCEAENGIKRVQTTGWLYVNPGENPLNLEGVVLPKYPELSFDEAGIGDEKIPLGTNQEVVQQAPHPSRLIPQNSYHNSQESTDARRVEDLEIKIQEALHFDRVTHSTGNCEIYTGTVCNKVFTESTRTIYIKGTLSQDELEASLKRSVDLIEKFDQVSSECSRFTLPVLCYKTFPQCVNSAVKGYRGDGKASYVLPRPRLLCKDECIMLENQVCKKEYAIAKEQPLIKHHLQTCHILPEIVNEGGRDCMRLGLINPEIIDPEQECYELSLGSDYHGTLSTTRSGQKCLKWTRYRSANVPNSHSSISRMPSSKQLTVEDDSPWPADHNFCRNPGGMRDQPWCFVSSMGNGDSDVRPELCDVAKCASALPATTNGLTQKLLITIPSLGLFFVLLAIVLLVCWCQKKSNSSGKSSKTKMYGNGNTKGGAKELLSNTSETIPLQAGQFQQPQEYPTSPRLGSAAYVFNNVNEISFGNLKFLQELGECNFGMVYKGELKAGLTHGGQPSASYNLPVAIKSLKPIASPNLRREFEKEIKVLSVLKHPNLSTFLGICRQNNLTYSIFEFLSKGDLHEFLLCRSPNSDIGSSSHSDATHHSLDQADFLYMAVHIACGMEYLAENGFVHKDLAARNCIVGENLLVKISNLGYASQAYPTDYYKMGSGRLVQPVRWMSPEAIQYGKFSTETDAWSFGILLWEIFSYGLQPYYGYTDAEVMDLIKNQQLLSSPDDCSSPIYEIMLECWNEMPSRRPSFQTLHSRLRSIEIRDKSIRARSTTLSSGMRSGGQAHCRNQPSLEVTSPRPRPSYYVTPNGDVIGDVIMTDRIIFRDHNLSIPAPRSVLKTAAILNGVAQQQQQPRYGQEATQSPLRWAKGTNGMAGNPHSAMVRVADPIRYSHDENGDNFGDVMSGNRAQQEADRVKYETAPANNYPNKPNFTDGMTSSSESSGEVKRSDHYQNGGPSFQRPQIITRQI